MINRIIPLIILLVVGCAPTYTTRYVYDTNPQGASFICNGENYGYTPKVYVWNNIDLLGENRPLTEEEITKITQGKISDLYTKDIFDRSKKASCGVHWSSGVSKKYPFPVPFNSSANGTFSYTLQRPEGAGYTQDAEFALKVKQFKQDQNEAKLNALIAISATQAKNRAAAAQERAAKAQERQNDKSTTCYTNDGITRCY